MGRLPEAMQTAKCVRREALLTAVKPSPCAGNRRNPGRVLSFGLWRLLSGFPHLRLRGRAGA